MNIYRLPERDRRKTDSVSNITCSTSIKVHVAVTYRESDGTLVPTAEIVISSLQDNEVILDVVIDSNGDTQCFEAYSPAVVKSQNDISLLKYYFKSVNLELNEVLHASGFTYIL